MAEDKASYKTIFKSTFLFGFVQIFNIITKVGINKAVAVFLGTEGMGVIGLFQSTINILKTGFDLGVSQSAVRDVSQAVNKGASEYSKIVITIKKMIVITSLLGIIVTFCLSPFLSQWTFGNSNFTYPFMWLSLVVFLNVLTDGQLAILKGARLLKSLAKASLYGSIVGLFTSVPLYYFLGDGGIVPSLIMAALASFIFSYYYVKQIETTQIKISLKEAFDESSVMLKMGIALMYVNFLVVLSDYIIRSYINHVSTLEMVGLFQAGSMIISSYFGVIIIALTTDYYPRISAINDDNEKVSEEFNRQVEVSLLIIGPLVIFFLFAMPFFINFLYTKEFIPIIHYLEYAVFGVLITICSNSLGFILLAKRATKVFFFTATVGRIVIVGVNILLYNLWGLKGLGIATIIAGCMHLMLMQAVIWKLYNIKMSGKLMISFILMMLLTVIAFFVKEIENTILAYVFGLILLFFSLIYALFVMKRDMNIDVVSLIKEKFTKK